MIYELITFSSSVYDGHEAERLSGFLPMIPLIFSWSAIAMATNMTNPFLNILRKGASSNPTKWTTLKWRVILLAFAFFVLLYYCVCYPEVYESFLYTLHFDFVNPMKGGVFPAEAWIGVFLFYIVMLPLTLFLFVKSVIEVLCSRQKISSETVIFKKFAGQKGIAQTVSIFFYFALLCTTADGMRYGVFVLTDFVFEIACYFFATFLWVFRKTRYDTKQDLERFKNEWFEHE